MKLFPRILFHSLDVVTTVRSVLDEEMSMGAQTSVHIYSAKLGLAFVWCQKRRHPLGHSVGVQCKSCGCLRPFEVKIDGLGRSAIVSCKGCAQVDTLYNPPGRLADLIVKQTGNGWAVDVFWVCYLIKCVSDSTSILPWLRVRCNLTPSFPVCSNLYDRLFRLFCYVRAYTVLDTSFVLPLWRKWVLIIVVCHLSTVAHQR
jgi:hypothetical protein